MNVGDPVTVNADRSTRNGQAGTVVSLDWVECTISVQLKIDGAVLEYAPHHLIARMIDFEATEPYAEQPTDAQMVCKCGHPHGIDRAYPRAPHFNINNRCWHDNGRGCPCRVFVSAGCDV